MSVATEFPPVVHIPERARPTAAGERPDPARQYSAPRHLALVPNAESPAAVAGLVRQLVPARVHPEPFGQSGVAWPLTVAPAVAPLRLTRRGVLVLSLLTVAAATLLLLVAHASAGSVSAGSTPTGGTQAAIAGTGTDQVTGDGPVTVQAGDTLWTIAQRVQPQRDPRQEVDRLIRLNHLHSVALTPGQTLKVG